MFVVANLRPQLFVGEYSAANFVRKSSPTNLTSAKLRLQNFANIRTYLSPYILYTALKLGGWRGGGLSAAR